MNLHLTDRYVDNDGVTLHYVSGGSGPLVVFVHGFPDFWFTWRHQLDAVAGTHSVAAMDTRGYNLSDRPTEQAAYDIELLVDDIAAVIADQGHESAAIVGHDWGASAAWHMAARRPDLVERLVIINMPHPDNLAAAVQSADGEQAAALSYTEGFREPGSEANFDASDLADFMAHGDRDTRARYLEAFERTSFTAAMNHYRQNSTIRSDSAGLGPITVPVLQFHGLDDPALISSSLNDTWKHLGSTWTLITLPGAGHWPHHDQPDLVASTITSWLNGPAPAARTRRAASPVESGCCG